MRAAGGGSSAGSGFKAREKNVELLRKKAARGRSLKDASPGVGTPVNDSGLNPPGRSRMRSAVWGSASFLRKSPETSRGGKEPDGLWKPTMPAAATLAETPKYPRFLGLPAVAATVDPCMWL